MEHSFLRKSSENLLAGKFVSKSINGIVYLFIYFPFERTAEFIFGTGYPPWKKVSGSPAHTTCDWLKRRDACLFSSVIGLTGDPVDCGNGVHRKNRRFLRILHVKVHVYTCLFKQTQIAKIIWSRSDPDPSEVLGQISATDLDRCLLAQTGQYRHRSDFTYPDQH